MKKHIISLAILLASGVSVFGQNTTYLSEIRITDRQVVKTSDRQVNVKMEVSLDELDIKRQHSLRVVPVILPPTGHRNGSFLLLSSTEKSVTRCSSVWKPLTVFLPIPMPL